MKGKNVCLMVLTFKGLLWPLVRWLFALHCFFCSLFLVSVSLGQAQTTSENTIVGRDELKTRIGQLTDYEMMVLREYAHYEAAYLKRASVELIAPDIQNQIQLLADEIAVSVDAKARYRIHLVNDPFVGTMSFASGDIFIHAGYLNMVENRDELAFAIAREIAIQETGIPLREMKEVYMNQERDELSRETWSIVTANVLGSIFNHLVTARIHAAILATYPYSVSDPIGSAQYSRDVAKFLNDSLGRVPGLAQKPLQQMLGHMIYIANTEADEKRRAMKNRMGLEYMQKAGYDPRSGKQVITKLDDYWKDVKRIAE